MLKGLCLSTSLLLLAWWIDFCIPPRNPPLVNYDDLVFFDRSPSKGPLVVPTSGSNGKPLSYLAPHSKAEIVTMVKVVAATYKGGGQRRKIRVVGSGHSWSAIAQSEDLLLSLSNYKGLVSLDKNSMQATFRAGTTFKEVNAILREHGLAMSQLGSISDQTVAGAIATGTHGSGIMLGNLATLVVTLELITASGEVLTLSAHDKDTDLFKAAQVSVGLLGVVSEVTFQCQPAFKLEETRSLLPLSDCLDNMHQLVHSARHVKMWVEVFSETCALYQSNVTEMAARDNPSPVLGLILNLVFEEFCSVIAWMPTIVPGAMKMLLRYGDPLPEYNRVDESYGVLNIPHYITHHNEGEVVVDMKHCATAIRELKIFVEDKEIPLNFITEVRFVSKDNIFLSPNYQRDSCHLTLCLRHASERDRLRYFVGVFKMLADKGLQPRVHWGKYFDLSGVKIDDLYPSLNRFLKIRRRLDPEGIFVNTLMSKTLGIVTTN